jgi:hypothetical protein
VFVRATLFVTCHFSTPGLRGNPVSPTGRGPDTRHMGRFLMATIACVLTVSAHAVTGGLASQRSSLLVYASIGADASPATKPSEINAENTSDLFVMSRLGRPLRRLTRTRLWEDEPAWSPDGTRIAFTLSDFTCHALACNETLLWSGIAVIPAAGGKVRRLTSGPGSGDVFDRSPAWSPDGRRLVFVREDVMGDPKVNGIWIVGADGGVPRRLIAGSFIGGVDWSPDGRRISFVNAQGRLRVVDLQTGRGETIRIGGLPGHPGQIFGATWSPNGREFAIDTEAGVFLAPVTGGRARRIAGAEYTDSAWASDGRQLAIERQYRPRQAPTLSQIYLVRRDGTGLRGLITGRRYSFDPDWEP